MNAPDLHTLTGAYAVNALDAEEREVFEVHLRECAACRAEVAELVATAARLGRAASATPPAGLRERVLAEISATRQLPPVTRTDGVIDLAPRRRAWYQQPAAAAAAVLLVVSAGLGATTLQARQDADQASERAARVVAIATDPDRVEKVVTMPAGGSGIVLMADGAAVLRTTEVRRLPAGQEYQLWVLRPEGPQSAGVLGRGGELEALVEDMSGAEGLGLTVEPEGGSPEPTGDLVMSVTVA